MGLGTNRIIIVAFWSNEVRKELLLSPFDQMRYEKIYYVPVDYVRTVAFRPLPSKLYVSNISLER